MAIPLSKPDLSALEKRYVTEVLESGQLSFGDKLRRFEKKFCHHFHMDYAVAMNSGTSALHVAVKALGLQPGDEVITTPYSFIASGNCLLYENVKPTFVDIDPGTLNMNTEHIEQSITPKTKALLVVHIFGQPCPMDDIKKIAEKHELMIIEDACEAIGATWKGKPVGSFGEAGVFAFYPNKQITTGEGGILLTNQPKIYETACSLRNQGRNMQNDWLEHERIGYNYRMSELQAAVGLAQMERLNDILAKREAVAQRYMQLIEDYRLPVILPKPLKHSHKSWFVFVLILPKGVNRNQLIRQLSEKGIQSKPYFPSIHLQPAYQQRFGFRPGSYPVSEEMSEQTIAIPFHSTLSLKEQHTVVKTLAQLI